MVKLTGMRLVKILATVFFVLTSVSCLSAQTGVYPAKYWEKLSADTVQCGLCPRRCTLKPGERGVCTVRKNVQGSLRTLGWGNPVAVHIDPIEKKPFFHVTPSAKTLSIAVAGCNMRCKFCQNWQISQSRPDDNPSYSMTPAEVVDKAIQYGCPFIVFTYTEPTVFYEYMLDIAKRAKQKGLYTGMHSCGYINPEPLKELLQYMDAVNIDLKGFTRDFYQKMGLMAELEPVLDTLKIIKQQGVWLEITHLIIPGQNDDPEKFREMCLWIKDNLGDDVPLHISRFFPAYKLRNLPPTPMDTLRNAYNIARETGLKYVYIGNVAGNPQENTYCPRCKKVIIRRNGYEVLENHVLDGKCEFCGQEISGFWGKNKK